MNSPTAKGCSGGLGYQRPMLSNPQDQGHVASQPLALHLLRAFPCERTRGPSSWVLDALPTELSGLGNSFRDLLGALELSKDSGVVADSYHEASMIQTHPTFRYSSFS